MINWLKETKEELHKDLELAALAAKNAGVINFEELPKFVIEAPREKAHGDFAANVAMVLAKQAKMPPRKIAEAIVAELYKDASATWVESVDIAGAGFINIKMKAAWLTEGMRNAASQGAEFGNSDYGKGEKVNVEFVSANPTGELHLGNARGAAIGDSLANIMAAAGFEVEKEFYINDAGNQIEKFGYSLEARYLQILGENVEFPEDGYHGDDIKRTMEDFITEQGDKYQDVEGNLRREILTRYALEKKISAIKAALSRYGVEYDTWFSEQTLHESGKVKAVIDTLDEKGFISESEDAIWITGEALKCEKPEVLVRANGIPTYFTGDIAYHEDKFKRGFTKLINVWGADHHGHVARLQNAMTSLGYAGENLDVVLMQLVRLLQDGEIVKMSKRAGTYVTLEELIDEVGVDAARFGFVQRSSDSQMDFDLTLAKSQTMDNPVYYVQYAHARINSILVQAKEQGIELLDTKDVKFDLLVEDSEDTLIRKILDLPEEIAYAAVQQEPHRIAVYAMEISALFHSFYGNCRCLGVDSDVQMARLWLCETTKLAIAKALTLIGVSAPDHM